MYCIPPIEITADKVISSTINEPDTGETPWAAGDKVKDVVVIRTTTHKKYRAIDAITGADNAKTPESAPNLWQEIGATNKYAMFELNRNTSSKATSITVVIAPGKRVSSIFLGGLLGTNLKIELLSATNVVLKTYDYLLSTRTTTLWSEYFFDEFDNLQTIINFDLPLISQVKIRVTLTTTAITGVAISSLVVGNAVYVGEIQWEPESDSQNYSKIERNFDGSLQPGVNLIRRRTVPILNLQTWAPKEITNQLRKLRNDLNAVPAVWTGLDQDSTNPYYEALLIFGIYRQFKINIKRLDWTVVTLSLEEM